MVRRATENENRTLNLTNRFRSLLVPVDGEPFGEHALPLALGIARRSGAEVRVVHVHCPMQSHYRPGSVQFDIGVDSYLRRRQQTYLDGLLRRLRKITAVRVTPIFLEGREVVDSLYDAASAGTDLVVMATHGRGVFGRFLFGSVAEVLMRRLSVPVLFVCGYNAPAELTGDPLLRNVLIPLDGSEVAEQILEPATALGAIADADHTLLRVVPIAPDYSLGGTKVGLARTLADQQKKDALSYLLRVAKRLGGGALRFHSRLVFDEESTAGAILHYAMNHDADLIALATRGRDGLARLIWGSVADRVIRGASVPVLAFRSGDWRASG